MVALGLPCCAQTFFCCCEQGLLFIAVKTSHCGGFSVHRLQELQLVGSRAQAQQLWSTGFSCSIACGTFPDQGLNLWNQRRILTGRSDSEANNLATWCKEPTHCKRPWCWERLEAAGEADDRGWHHWLNGHEFEQIPGDDGKGQGSLACCSPWGHKVSDMTQRLNNSPCVGW